MTGAAGITATEEPTGGQTGGAAGDLPPGIGFCGKHPGFGDFFGLGVDPALRHALDLWLETALPEAAAALGEGWNAVWDASPGFGFWIGGQVWTASGGAALRGWLLPARDRVGRRWPLIVLQHPAPADPPPLAGDDGFAAAAAASARATMACGAAAVAALAPCFTPLAGFAAAADPASPLLWAVNPALPAGKLWSDLAALDHRRAAQHSAYLWADPLPGRAAAVLATTGLPAGAMIAWLLAGVPGGAVPPAQNLESSADISAEPVSDRSLDDVRD